MAGICGRCGRILRVIIRTPGSIHLAVEGVGVGPPPHRVPADLRFRMRLAVGPLRPGIRWTSVEEGDNPGLPWEDLEENQPRPVRDREPEMVMLLKNYREESILKFCITTKKK